MKSKIIQLIVGFYLLAFMLESCNERQCDRRETRNITNIAVLHYKSPTPKSQRLEIRPAYQSYFVYHSSVSLFNKSYARSIDIESCFESYANDIKSISITSDASFSSSFPAGTEINSKFKSLESDLTLDTFTFTEDTNPFNEFIYMVGLVSYPAADSIHTLFINITLEDQQQFTDTLANINLNDLALINF